MWKQVGKDGLAVKAPWPEAGEEDKILTREASFLRSALKTFRAQAGKAKKGCDSATMLVTDSYPQWKADTLVWMQQQYDSTSASFPPSFMKDLKTWSTSNVTDKKVIKLTMQFASFMKKEVQEVGAMAMDIKLPFEQKSILLGSEQYIKSQLKLETIDILQLDADDATAVPDRIKENVNPGKPYLWMH